MPIGQLKVRRNAKRETVFAVHHWPDTTGLPWTCSSVCAYREISASNVATLSPKWAHPDDAAEINRRLATPASHETSGETKGRVLYLFDATPLHAQRRVVAAALMTVTNDKLFKMYRVCFNEAVVEFEREDALNDLVGCAAELARDVGAKLHFLVPPRAQPGKLKVQLGSLGTTKDRYGQTWLTR